MPSIPSSYINTSTSTSAGIFYVDYAYNTNTGTTNISRPPWSSSISSAQKLSPAPKNGKLRDEYLPADVWYRDGALHREDGPAIERDNGDKEWYLNGDRHRDNGPAIEYASGDREWWINGNRHRVDGPAIDHSAVKKWYHHNVLHRKDGPAVEWSNGEKYWYQQEQLHRTDGPAKELVNGDTEWYLNGQRHRVDGPALIHGTRIEYWIKSTLHREDGPAMQDTATGLLRWYLQGERVNVQTQDGFSRHMHAMKYL